MVLVYLLVMALFVVIGVFTTKEFRATAREKLSGKWGKAVCIVLAYLLISFLLSFVTALFDAESAMYLILNLAVSIINVPLSYGMVAAFFKLYNNEDVKAFDFLSFAFSNFGRAWAVSLWTFLKLLLPLVLYIVGIALMAGCIVFTSFASINGDSSVLSAIFALFGLIIMIISMVWLVIRSYTYEMAGYVAIDSPELTAKEAVQRSKEIMPGNRAKLFWLTASFGGWMFLAILTFGIGVLWLAPYMQVAYISFYYFVAGKKENKTSIEESSNDIANSTEA